LLVIKKQSKIAVSNIAIFTYALPILTSALSIYVIFAKTKNKMVIIREDQMLTKVLHIEKNYGSKSYQLNFQTKRLN